MQEAIIIGRAALPIDKTSRKSLVRTHQAENNSGTGNNRGDGTQEKFQCIAKCCNTAETPGSP